MYLTFELLGHLLSVMLCRITNHKRPHVLVHLFVKELQSGLPRTEDAHYTVTHMLCKRFSYFLFTNART